MSVCKEKEGKLLDRERKGEQKGGGGKGKGRVELFEWFAHQKIRISGADTTSQFMHPVSTFPGQISRPVFSILENCKISIKQNFDYFFLVLFLLKSK